MNTGRMSLFFSLCLAAAVAVSAGAAGTTHAFTLHGITFESGVEFSAPEKAGLDAWMVLHPRKAKPGSEKLGMTAVLFTGEAQKAMGMGDAELVAYARTTFMGAAAAGRPVERVFAGKKAKGDIVEKKIPKPMTVETYIVKLRNGSKVAIAFNYAPEFKADAERIIAELAASMKE